MFNRLLPIAFITVVLAQAATDSAPVSYQQQVRPLLAAKCAMCHTGETGMSGYDVSSVATLRQAGKKAGPGVVPGQPDASSLLQYVSGTRQPRMPRGMAPLTSEETGVLRRWIEAGAPDDSGPAQLTKVNGPKLAAPKTDDAFLDKLTSTLFNGSYEDLMVLRRNLRVSQLPAVAAPLVQAWPDSANPIDQFIAARWKKGLPPPALCSDQTFLRRVYLDLIGVVPTIAETKRFLADARPDKRARLIDELLARREDYAAHWTPFWEEALGSGPVTGVGGIASRGNYQQWILKSFARNRPFDVMVAELIDPAMPNRQPDDTITANGRVWQSAYVLNDSHVNTIQTAANTAQVFMGTGMKCASCHNHFLNAEWSQQRFLSFASLFGGEDLEVIRCEQRSGKYVQAEFPFALPGVPANVDKKDEKARRARAAQLITDPFNPRFAKTIVNRLWKRYLGLGLYEPVDDFRLDRQASHPELLDWLADDFMRHGYDLQHTIRLLLTSRTYQARYNPAEEDHFDITQPDTARSFRSPSLRRLTAEQVIDGIGVITTQRLDPQRRVYLDKTSTALTRLLGRPASRNEISTGRPGDVAVVQALELLNGDEFSREIYTGDLLAQSAEQQQAAAIDTLYMAALQRAPTTKEQKLSIQFLRTIGRPALASRPAVVETTWFDDAPPAGAVTEPAAWPESTTNVHTGSRARRQISVDKPAQHFFMKAGDALLAGPRDTLFTWVYLDPANPPRELSMAWNREGTRFTNRVYWAAAPDAQARDRTYLGPLPATGEWVRLEAPMSKIDFKVEGRPITGWSFEQTGGMVDWDSAGVLRQPLSPSVEPLGDLLWALLVSPEFQYIH